MTLPTKKPNRQDVINPREERFIAEYLIDLNALAAATRAGYRQGVKSGNIGARLMGRPRVMAEIARRKTRQLAAVDITARRVLEEIARLSFSNVKALFDERGNLRPIQDLTRDEAACIASLEIIKKNAEAGDGQTDVIHKVRIWDKTKSLEMLAKHFALLTERVEHGGELVIRHEL